LAIREATEGDIVHDDLTITYGTVRVVLEPGQAGGIGRNDSNVLIVDDPSVSREHLRVSWVTDGWVLENLGRGGTFFHGQAIASCLPLCRPTEVRLAAPDGPSIVLSPGSGGVDGVSHRRQETPDPFPGRPDPAPSSKRSELQAFGRPSLQEEAGSALKILMPIREWVRAPELRQWYRLLVALYTLSPVFLLVVLKNHPEIKTFSWAYSLYVAPIWVMVCWYLIRPGRVTRTMVAISAAVIGAEFLLIPTFVRPWEDKFGPDVSGPLTHWIFGVGLAEELAKAIPLVVLSYGLLRFRDLRLDARVWMFIGTLSGLTFGASEASQYISSDSSNLLEVTYRLFADGIQHGMWAGIAGFFIGLGTNYRRQRIPLWAFGILIPTILHGLNDWQVVSGTWWWLAVQLLTVVLFLGYSATAGSIDRSVRSSPIFRGESIIFDRSRELGAL
jgi:RsiW-degrading membrane proteinase PrsW (M82 family)